MDITLRVWVPENQDTASVVTLLEMFLQQGVAPLPDLMQRELDRAYGVLCARKEQLFHCGYPRGPIHAGITTGLRTHRHIAYHVANAVPFIQPEADIPIPAFTCAICLEECSSSLQQQILPCMHKFHRDCIDRWMQTQTTCPECRTPIS